MSREHEVPIYRSMMTSPDREELIYRTLLREFDMQDVKDVRPSVTAIARKYARAVERELHQEDLRTIRALTFKPLADDLEPDDNVKRSFVKSALDKLKKIFSKDSP